MDRKHILANKKNKTYLLELVQHGGLQLVVQRHQSVLLCLVLVLVLTCLEEKEMER